jgi:hypothetical protein
MRCYGTPVKSPHLNNREAASIYQNSSFG